MNQTGFLYSPALRLKQGEQEGLRQLASPIKNLIVPRFIIPPHAERDDTTPCLLDSQRVPDFAQSVSTCWRRRPVLIDSSCILDEFGLSQNLTWMPSMFQRARSIGVYGIPTAMLADILRAPAGFAASIEAGYSTKFCLVIPFGEIDEPDFRNRIKIALGSLGVGSKDCAVIADYGQAEFDNPENVAPVIGNALETLQVTGLWRQIIFQGSSYPDKNPAPDDGIVARPRNEWRAWRKLVDNDPAIGDYAIFGDYAADCSKMDFGTGAIRPIAHIRYCAGSDWLVHRGPKEGKDSERIHQVYKSIAGSPEFAGRTYSHADAFIEDAARDIEAPHGNASTWRQLNTTHHVTQVARDIARSKGIDIPERAAADTFQPSFFGHP